MNFWSKTSLRMNPVIEQAPTVPNPLTRSITEFILKLACHHRLTLTASNNNRINACTGINLHIASYIGYANCDQSPTIQEFTSGECYNFTGSSSSVRFNFFCGTYLRWNTVVVGRKGKGLLHFEIGILRIDASSS